MLSSEPAFIASLFTRVPSGQVHITGGASVLVVAVSLDSHGLPEERAEAACLAYSRFCARFQVDEQTYDCDWRCDPQHSALCL